jgi:hypothetical protein
MLGTREEQNRLGPRGEQNRLRTREEQNIWNKFDEKKNPIAINYVCTRCVRKQMRRAI